ncbi:MAG: hypothetical protein ACJAYG_001269 [Oceanicoccus sp.]|jgi:hypothetical protein
MFSMTPFNDKQDLTDGRKNWIFLAPYLLLDLLAIVSAILLRVTQITSVIVIHKMMHS